MSLPYKFTGTQGLIERGANRYGTKKNCDEKECPTCFGGGRHGLFNCKECNGTGKVDNVKSTKCDICGTEIGDAADGLCSSCRKEDPGK